MSQPVPVMKQVLAQAPRFQLDDDLALTIERVKGGDSRDYELDLEWSVGSRWEVLGEVSEQSRKEWLGKLIQGLNRTLGEGIPSLAIPALMPSKLP
jgi:hypothetical protein